MTRKLKPCGTLAAYKRHISKGEKPCNACQQANTDHANAFYHRSPEHRAVKARRALARQRAFARLKALHPVEYRRLYAEEIQRSERGEAP